MQLDKWLRVNAISEAHHEAGLRFIGDAYRTGVVQRIPDMTMDEFEAVVGVCVNEIALPWNLRLHLKPALQKLVIFYKEKEAGNV